MEDSQVWLIIGVIVGAVAILIFLGVFVNAYITTRRLAAVLSDVEEIMHADFKDLEQRIEAALVKIRLFEAKMNRE
jgi:hypothetical protein